MSSNLCFENYPSFVRIQLGPLLNKFLLHKVIRWLGTEKKNVNTQRTERKFNEISTEMELRLMIYSAKYSLLVFFTSGQKTL